MAPDDPELVQAVCVAWTSSLQSPSEIIQGSGHMNASASTDGPIKVGVITDQTGPLSVMGIANANVAKMVIDDINAEGGLLGRRVDLYLEDSETTDSVGEAKAAKLVQEDQVD